MGRVQVGVYTKRHRKPFHVFHREKDLIIFAFYRDYTSGNETERTLFREARTGCGT